CRIFAPDAVRVAGAHSKNKLARRQAVKIRRPSRARFAPLLVQSIQPIAKADLLRRVKAQARVMKLELPLSGRQPESERRSLLVIIQDGGWLQDLALPVCEQFLQYDPRRPLLQLGLLRIDQHQAANRGKAKLAGFGFQTRRAGTDRTLLRSHSVV